MIDQIGPKRPGPWVEITLSSTDILVVCLEETVEAFLAKCRLVPDEYVRFDAVWYWNQERNKLIPQEGGYEGYLGTRWCRRGAIISMVPFQDDALPILNLSKEREDAPGPPGDGEGDPEGEEKERR